MAEWEEQKYEEVFESTLKDLKHQNKVGILDISELKNKLKSSYVKQENDWVGRGRVAEIVDAATIAAYELFLAEWNKYETNS